MDTPLTVAKPMRQLLQLLGRGMNGSAVPRVGRTAANPMAEEAISEAQAIAAKADLVAAQGSRLRGITLLHNTITLVKSRGMLRDGQHSHRRTHLGVCRQYMGILEWTRGAPMLSQGHCRRRRLVTNTTKTLMQAEGIPHRRTQGLTRITRHPDQQECGMMNSSVV